MDTLLSMFHQNHPLRVVKAEVLFLILIILFSAPCLSGEEEFVEEIQTRDLDRDLDVEILKSRITEEAPGELMNLNLGDSEVSLVAKGRWKGSLQAGWGFALTPFGTRALSSDTPFFSQEVDLTLSLWIRERWFVEANFVDNSSLNTYRAGYQGQDGEVVRYVGVGNTGLDFPIFPYLDLGGDTPSSFGAYGHFAVGNLSLHSMVRYDAAAREEKIFVGDRERSYVYTDLSRPQRGTSFILPDENLSAIPVVYIQDNRGALLDSDGRRWRIAEPSEYGASARFGIVELSLGAYTGGATQPEAMIAVYYPGGYNMGTYADSLSGNSFLGRIQEYFDDSAASNPSIRLWDYPQPGQREPNALGDPANNIPGTVTINGINALVIYEPGTFSPFEKQNRYPAPVSTSIQASLVKLSSGDIVRGYDIVPMDNNFQELQIQSAERVNVNRGMYELVRDGSRDRRSPVDCWPLGDTYPAIYLPGRTAFTEDLGIRFTNYGAVGALVIGTDVVPGSVQVYRNGILDPNFTFSSSGGIVSLGNPAGFNEIIRITYLRQSSERRLGSLAAGIGALWDPEGPFSGRLGLGLRWNVTSESYSEDGASSPGTVGLGAEARWDYERIRAGITLGLGFEQPDATGLYRVAGMEGNEVILSLPPVTSFVSEVPVSLSLRERADLIYRNYLETSILGNSSLMDISSGAPVITGESGPYPASDKTLSSSTQVLVAEFELSAEKTWTGFQTPLGVNGDFLEKAGKIEVPFRFMNFPPAVAGETLSVKLQFGALSDKDSGYHENPDLIVELNLYDESISTLPDRADRPRIASFTLGDEDRKKLQHAKYLRLLIERSGDTGIFQGRVILAPPIVWGSFWRPVTVKGNEINGTLLSMGLQTVNASEQKEFGANKLEDKYPGIINQLHGGNSSQRVLEISWDDFSSNDTGPGADGRIKAVPLSTYRSLSFFIRRPLAAANDQREDSHPDQVNLDSGKLRFILAQGPSSLKRPEEIALEAEIPLKDFNCVRPGEWARVDIQYSGGNSKIYVEGNASSGPPPRFRPNAAASLFSGTDTADTGRSSYAALFLVPGNLAVPKGSMAIDEIILEDSMPSYRLNNGTSFEYRLPGTVLEIRDLPVISDISFQAALETGAHGNPFENGSGEPVANGSFGMNGRSHAGVSVLGLKINGNYSYSFTNSVNSDSNYAWSAGHNLFRAFGPFSFTESFDDSPADMAMNHRLAFALNTRVGANLSGEVVQDLESVNRIWQAGAGGRPAEKIPLDFSLNAIAEINEKTGLDMQELSNYARDWAMSFVPLVPDSGADADARNLSGSTRLRLITSPLGTELYFQGNTSFSTIRNISGSGSLLRLDFPLNPGNTDLRMFFRSEREYKRDIFEFRSDFRDDGENWAESFGDSVPLMFSIPLYSLFDPNMGKKMDDFATVSGGMSQDDSYPELSQFSDRFEFSLLQTINYSLSSLFLPSRFSFRLNRVLEQKLDIPRDTLIFGAVLGFSSVNMFGAMGVAPLFNFYQGDEFSHSVETQIFFPKNEIVSWMIRADESMTFYGFRGAELAINNTFTINSPGRIGEGNRWTDSLNVSWTVPMEKTLLGNFYSLFTGMAGRQSSWLTLAKIAEYDYELLRRESLEFVFERIPNAFDGDYNRFSIILGHESIVRIFGRLYLSVFGKIAVSEDTGTRITSFMGTIGTTLSLMF